MAYLVYVIGIRSYITLINSDHKMGATHLTKNM